MTKLLNKSLLKDRRRSLRKSSTPHEKILWETILRFTNSEIENDREKVIKMIKKIAQNLPSTYEGEGLGVRYNKTPCNLSL